MNKLLNDWVDEWLNDWLIRINDWSSEWNTDSIIEWMNDWMNEWWHDTKLEEAMACRNTDYVIKKLGFINFDCRLSLFLET